MQILGYPVSSILEEKWIETAGMPSNSDKVFVIETLAERAYIGAIGLHGIDWIIRSAEIGIVIGDKSRWGTGYGTDAMRVIMRLGFDKMNLHRMWLRVFDFNQRAIVSDEKCGFRRWGVLRDGKFLKGKYHDTIIMGIVEDEYRAMV
ncbi:MAG TPA: GNAT family protein [Candidatus Binataceae bacterium]